MHCSQATQKQTEARDGGVKQCALLLPEQAWCINNHFLTLGFLPLVVGMLADIGFPLAFWGGQSALAVRAACHTATCCDRYLSPPCSCSFFLSRCSILCVCQCLCVCVCVCVWCVSADLLDTSWSWKSRTRRLAFRGARPGSSV